MAVPRSHCCPRKKISVAPISSYAPVSTRSLNRPKSREALKVAITGLNSIRQTLDSLARLAGHLQPASTQVNVAVQTNVNVGARQIAERLIQKFDHEPELKAQIAQALLEVDDEQAP